ncbi:tRNA-dependent cyclodipeptide synthase [Streptomyces abikoensis]|uniref:tRNA-dependent cyclodipeptide synthase n=1 Tax=Streptomyces abikoensis TaxID=97398 RepID=UPI001673330F|nr:tRNA-dependent cyclodipeptide synthase [Streptomyces abikoensis]GGP46803.1 hypothetical protein GCM10010214_19950 [Streptomyces abikoensis]
MEFVARPCTRGSHSVLKHAEHTLIGIRPWNSHYRPRTVEGLVEWACGKFAAADVSIPVDEAVHILTTTGVPRREAVRRAERTIGKLRTPALRALHRTGGPNPKRRFHTCTQLADCPDYQPLLELAQHAYMTAEAVRHACRLTVRGVMLAAVGIEPTENQVAQAVGYVITELPLVLDAPSILEVQSSLFVFHCEMGFLEPLLAGKVARLHPDSGQGYAVIQPGERDSAVGHLLWQQDGDPRYDPPTNQGTSCRRVLAECRKNRQVRRQALNPRKHSFDLPNLRRRLRTQAFQ